MAVIGIDSHKDTLAGCLVTSSGEAIEHRSIANDGAGHAELVAWASAADVQRVGIEASGNYGHPAAEALIDAGIAVVEVPPQMTATAYRGQRTRAKTDQVDALEIARITARDDELPTPRFSGTRDDLACLVDYCRAAKTVAATTNATPIISVNEVVELRLGLREAFSLASSPVIEPRRTAGAASSRLKGRTIVGPSSTTAITTSGRAPYRMRSSPETDDQIVAPAPAASTPSPPYRRPLAGPRSRCRQRPCRRRNPCRVRPLVQVQSQASGETRFPVLIPDHDSRDWRGPAPHAYRGAGTPRRRRSAVD